MKTPGYNGASARLTNAVEELKNSLTDLAWSGKNTLPLVVHPWAATCAPRLRPVARPMDQTTEPPPVQHIRRPYILNIPRAQIGKGFAKESKYSDRAFPVVIGGSYPPGTEFDSPPGDPVRILPEQAWMQWGLQAAARHRATLEDLALADATTTELARRVVEFKLLAAGLAILAAAGWALLLAPVVLA